MLEKKHLYITGCVIKQPKGAWEFSAHFKKTYLPDFFTVLFDAWISLVCLTHQSSTFLCIPSTHISARLQALD
jgi:hypothetical protein